MAAKRLTTVLVNVMGAENAVMKTVRYGIQVGEGGVWGDKGRQPGAVGSGIGLNVAFSRL
jgi:hypothetical protein